MSACGCRVRARFELRLVEPVLQRLAVVVSEDVLDAAERVLYYVGRLVVAVRPCLSEVGDRDHHQRRVRLPEALVAQPKRRQRARPEVLHDQVCLIRQPPEYSLAGDGFQVERDRPLVRVQVQKRQPLVRMRVVARERPHAARRVARARTLDLDDLRPEVREQLRAVRTRDMVSQVQDLDSAESSAQHRLRFTKARDAGQNYTGSATKWAGHPGSQTKKIALVSIRGWDGRPSLRVP